MIRHTRTLLRSLITIATLTVLTACVYRIDVQQGNYIDRDKLDQVEAGMERRQVQFLLGNPVAQDAFRDDVWHYVAFRRLGASGVNAIWHAKVFFDEQGLVARVEHDGVPDNQSGQQTVDPDQDTAAPSVEPENVLEDTGAG